MTVLYLDGLSLLTPLGADLEMVKTSVDAGISSYQQCALFGDDVPSIRFSPVPEDALNGHRPPKLPGMSLPQIRLLNLAIFALADFAPQLPQTPLPLFLAGPQPYYNHSALNHQFLNHLAISSGVTLDIGNSRCINTGRAGMIDAIATAFKYFDATHAHYALVGGIDSFYDHRTLGILQKSRRLSGDDSFDGFVPGEGAGFLLLTSPHAPEAVRSKSLLTLHRPATVYEPGHLLGDAPYTAEALSSAFQQAMSATDATINTIYSSENGEMHYTKELSVATLRQQHRMSATRKIHRPAEFFGDLGAAFAPVAIGLASTVIQANPEMAVLVYASSDGGSRAALCLSANHIYPLPDSSA